MKSFAADLFGAKSQIPRKPKLVPTIRPFGPFGAGKCQSSLPISGRSRTATAQAEGGFMISEPCPEIRNLLFSELSQANTLSGRCGTIFLNHSRTCLTASELTVVF